MASTIRDHWGQLSGSGHGGRKLLSLYLSEAGIGAEIDLSELMDIVINTVGLTHLVSAVLMDTTPIEPPTKQVIMVPTYEAFGAFKAKHAIAGTEQPD